MRRFLLCGLAVFAAAARAGAADSQDAALAALIAEVRHPVRLEGGRLTGSGARLLERRAAKAQHLLFGEQHATADIAEFATALYRLVAPLGYSAAVIEVGPWSTRKLEELVREDQLEEFLSRERNLLSIPFYFFREEAEFLEAVTTSSSRDDRALIGLDQEFIAAAPVVLPLLEGAARTPEEEAAVAEAAAAARADPMFIGSASEAQLRALADAFRSNPAMRDLAAGLVLSNRIYQPFVKGEGSIYEANRLRENYMKRNHLRLIDDSGGKLFYKFGANHLARGVSPTQVLSLGTFVIEQAFADGHDVFSVHVDCLGGLMRVVQTGATTPCRSYYLEEDSAILEHVPREGISLFDLASLRGRRELRDADEATRRLVDAYDTYVVIPDVRPATFFPGELPDFGEAAE